MSPVTFRQLKELLIQIDAGRVTRQNLAAFLKNPNRFGENGSQYLCLLSGQSITIGPTKGERIIANAEDVFTAGIDGDFNNWGVNRPGAATKEMVVSPPYELVQNGNFAQIFGSLAADLPQLCWTQEQIIAYVVAHPDQFASGENFFLTESNEEFFVARVYFYDDGRLHANVYRFESAEVWDAVRRPRFFVPQLPVPQQGRE